MKKKLLFINGHLNTGGVEKSLLDILKQLDYEKYSVDLLLTEAIGDYVSEIPPQVNVILRSLENTYGPFGKCILRCLMQRDWFSLGMRMILLMQKLWGIRRISMAQKLMTSNQHYDCVIGFRPGICMQLAMFAVNAERRVGWWHHGEMNVDAKTYQETAVGCDKIAVVSNSCKMMLAEKMPILADKLTIVHNIIDTNCIQLKANEFEPFYERNVLHIISVGRLSPEKHFENAIYAAKALKDNGIFFKWHLIGDGVLRDALREKAKQMDVADCFLFEGNQVNPYPYMKYADLFVHPSYVESFGIVVAEALTLGLPCVVTKSMGVLEFLRDGENAVLTEQSPESLTEKVLAVLADNDLRDKLRKNAGCPKQFCPDVVMEKIDQVLEADE